ncbi:MAG: zinc ribbon domain-containing protein, partial [Promethearchaeota archaeon]
NDGVTDIDVDFTVNFTAANVVNFNKAQFHINNTIDTTLDSTQFIVPSSGDWYFFIYFEPMNAPPPDASTLIEFSVSYDTGVTYQERWFDVQWILIIILVVVVILIIAAVIARRGQKKLKLKEPITPEQQKISPYKTTPTEPVEKEMKCPRCDAPIKADSKFCPKCGGKIEGRQVGVPSISTPADSKTCSLCGSKLTGTEKFCKWCGTQVEQ